jgi:phosphatidylserine/phosphatidylglycerophosphate/cardiolipin synthase-like enzyme
MATEVHLHLPPPTASGLHREAHAYGPDGAGFNTDLAIEIDPTVLASNPALAVASGLIRVIPGPALAATATLVLQPSPIAMNDLTSVVGESVVVFLYRNIDVASVGPRFQPRIAALGDQPFLTSEPLGARVARFTAGEFAVFVNGGDELGLPSNSAGTDGWGRLGFEIAFVPGGLRSAEGWARLVQLVDPAEERTRRRDPMSFFRRVELGTASVTLAPPHAGHLLLTLPTRRILLELRNEYDFPVVGSVGVQNDTTGVSLAIPLPASARGHAELATTPPGGTPPSASYTALVANHVLTELPSGTSAVPAATATLTAPAHWALQSIFMADVDDAGNWFARNTAALPRYTEGNSLTHLIDGKPTFGVMVPAMRTVTATGHYLRLAGWWLTDSFELIDHDPSSTFAKLSQAMATGGAEVRALLWDQWGSQNSDEVAHINALPGGHGQAILDNETPSFGSHHQKLLIINGSGGAVAFCGGVDINPDRLDDGAHRAASPFHDVHIKVEGPAVGNLNTTFVQRWNNHPSRLSALPVAAPPFAARPGTQYVQVTRTFSPGFRYPFTPPGDEVGTVNGVRRAIQRAQRFVYLEEQYATPYPGAFPYVAAQDTVGVLTDLLAALARPSFEYLIIVIPNHTDQPQNRYRRRNFIRPLRDAFPGKVFPFFLGRSGAGAGPAVASPTAAADQNLEPGGTVGPSSSSGGPARPTEIYVHSKVWMVDDVYVKIGSANCNRRSYTYDTEVDIHVVDGALRGGARAFARRFRMDLWGEHLNLSGAGGRNRVLEDPTLALRYWQHPPPNAHIRPYDENAELEAIHTDLSWNTFVDPDGR